MIEAPFYKLQSIGNDFVLAKMDDLAPWLGDEPDSALARFAIEACDRHFGVGSDGLLTLEKRGSELSMRMFNPDGTEDFCGNGLRCAGFFANLEGWCGEAATILHGSRSVDVKIGDGGFITTVTGNASYLPEQVPVCGPGELFDVEIVPGHRGSALTTGSTHTLLQAVRLPDDDRFIEVSSKLEVDPRFPLRTSVIWVREDGPSELSVRIWERGVGETRGCGTGSSAAVADYVRRKGAGGSIMVHNPGGDVRVSLARWDDPIRVEGRAQLTFAGRCPAPGHWPTATR